MSFRTRLLVFGYPLIEIATAYLVALWIGWGWMLLLLLIGFPVGFAIMRNAGDAAFRDAVQQPTPTAPSGRHAVTFLAGLLILIPGFWTDVLGLLLLLPPVQALVRRRGSAWIDARTTMVRMPGVRYPGGDVIQGTVIHRDEPGSDEPPSDLPRIGPGY
jgi:UPF0716 protein FxsA